MYTLNPIPSGPPELHEPLGCENLHNICLLIVLVLLGVLNHKSGFHFPISKPTYMLQLTNNLKITCGMFVQALLLVTVFVLLLIPTGYNTLTKLGGF